MSIIITIKTDTNTGKVNCIEVKSKNHTKVYKNKKALKIARISMLNKELFNRWLNRFFLKD